MTDPIPTHLDQLKPDGLDDAAATWQQRKSAQTRMALLEAAVECLHKVGYGSTTTHLIAQRADISRGAMLHHYATKQDLIAAVIDYVFYRRLEVFTAKITALTEEQRVHENAGIELYWQSLLTREFQVYLELEIASRTDVELRQIFIPKARVYDRIERAKVLETFPEWKAAPENYELAMDYCVAGMVGLLLNRDLWDDHSRRVRLRGFISSTILMLRDGKIGADGRIPPSPSKTSPRKTPVR